MHTVNVSVEIERKFVPAERPATDTLGPGVAMRQGYLAEEGDVSVRVRISELTAVLTVKGGHGLSRTEVEVPISLEQAEALWPHTIGRRVDKTRHRVALSDGLLVADVDVYAGALSGLCTVEVEFESEDAARAFTPPNWFGREVTGQVEWTNAALARHGRVAR
jgi:CYTH domain-containing protein